MSKTYTYTENQYTALPRSERLRKLGNAAGYGGSVTTVNGGGSAIGVTDHSQLTGIKCIDDTYSDYDRDIHLTAAAAKALAAMSGLEILTTTDTTKEATDKNVFSALRTRKEITDAIEGIDDMYLRKDIDDTAHGVITFDRKIGSTIFLDGWEGKGWEITSLGAAQFDSAKIRSDLYAGNKIGSPTFASGFTGWGIELDIPSAKIEADNLFIRKTFTAYEVVFSQVYGLGGSQIVSDLNKIKSVETLSDRYRCYMDDMDGLMLMNLREGDGVRIQARTGTTSIKFLVGRCLGITNNYFDIAIPLLEGTNIPAAGDFATRWGNESNPDRQGLIYLTTADSGAPFIDVYDGITGTSTEGCLKARLGKLAGVRTKHGDQLSGYGAYLSGIYIEDSTLMTTTGETVEQRFIAMNGRFESLIEGVRSDMSSESGNLLRNSSFSSDTKYWSSASTAHFITVNDEFLYLSGYNYIEKNNICDIIQDGSRKVLRILNNAIRQTNDCLIIPVHETAGPYTYSFALYYKVLRAGTLCVGFAGTDLYDEETLTVSDTYKKLSKVAKWNETGDFTIAFDGEILIYGVALLQDELADAKIELQTQILQNAEAITLRATKSYVDSQDGSIKETLESSITVQANRITAVSSRVTSLESASAGWITEADGNTLWATTSTVNSLGTRITTAESSIQQNANNISLKVSSNGVISAINQSSETIKMSASKIEFESKMITANNYFKILADGSMQAVNGDFSGKITAMSGTIGGLTLASDKMTGTGFEINSYGIFFTDGTSTAAMGSSTMDGSAGINPMLWIQDTAASARDGIFINFPNAYTTGGTAYNNNAVKIIGDVFTFGGMCNYEAVTLNIEMSDYYNHRQVYVFYPSGTATPTKYLPSISNMYHTNGSSFFYAEYVIMVKDDSLASILLKPYGSDIFINTQSGSRTTIKSIEIYPRNIVKVAYCLGQWYLLSTTNNVTITNN